MLKNLLGRLRGGDAPQEPRPPELPIPGPPEAPPPAPEAPEPGPAETPSIPDPRRHRPGRGAAPGRRGPARQGRLVCAPQGRPLALHAKLTESVTGHLHQAEAG